MAIPRIDGYSIKETKNPFSRNCIFVSERDSIFDFTVCRFDRDSGEKLDRYLRMEYAYVPPGFAVSHTDSTNHFGNHPSIGHLKVMVDSSVPKRFTIAIHRVESGNNLIGVVSRVKKELPSDAWFERNRKWRYSWKFLLLKQVEHAFPSHYLLAYKWWSNWSDRVAVNYQGGQGGRAGAGPEG